MTLTPNLKLEEILANTRTWTDKMNNNLLLIDAAIGAYFVLQNLQGIWENSHAYESGQTVVDGETAAVWTCQVDHISAGIPSTFAEERAVNADYWSVYSSPARARGTWTPDTAYAINDFVVSGTQYAVCIASHTSSSSFSVDVASGKWSILIDLSLVGSQVLPVLSGIVDQDKFVASNSLGTGYTIIDAVAALKILGATSIGQAVLQAASGADARSAIGAQAAGSYQPLAAYLSAISTLSVSNNTIPYINSSGVAAIATLTSFARTLIDDATATDARSTLGLGSAAVLDVGTAANNVVQLNGTGQLPAVNAALLVGATPATSDDSTKLATTEFVKNVVQAMPAFRVMVDGVTTIGASAKMPLSSAAAVNVGNYWNTSTQRFTPPAGTYSLKIGLSMAVSNSSGTISLYKNGSMIAQASQGNSQTWTINLSIDIVDVANGTDYYEAYWQSPGAVSAPLATQAWFCGHGLDQA